MLNTFFSSCFKCPLRLLSASHTPASDEHSASSLSELSCDGSDVLWVICALRNRTATGPDEIGYHDEGLHLQRTCLHINASFSSGKVALRLEGVCGSSSQEG